MNNFSKRLRELRVEKNLSQSELAKLIGVTQSGIAKWETGVREPSIDVLISLSKFFGYSLDYIVGIED